MARQVRALVDVPGGASTSVAERPPRSRGVALLGFVAALLLAIVFALTLLRKKPVNVPRGLLGVRFGMSESDALRQLPELSPRADGTLAGKGRVLEETGSCELTFGAKHTLTAVTCTIESSDRERAKRRVVATARQLYGDESSWQSGETERWTWQSSSARLSVIASRDGVRVENVKLE